VIVVDGSNMPRPAPNSALKAVAQKIVRLIP
jgi:hypothetical protein